jgi:hypothetical protein
LRRKFHDCLLSLFIIRHPPRERHIQGVNRA